MKKTALTFGLFSLVVLATSFSAPIDGGAAGGIIRKKDVAFMPIDGGAAGGIIRKKDVAMLPIDGGAAGGIIRKKDVNASEMNSRNLNFASVNQSIGNDKKVD
ncbi:hypothetical protein [Flavobacterium sp. YJ01]|uniref:hypothetical protein n=1 Tax=unclassified Flavobacterium TaxID=196869 RepID=UPI0023E3A28F|nr:hypothetical protein [Flavobacterium sp. YJ01]WET00829.1 hypothetical protein P0R33_13720 [Flavobacterium sp. YJ01]